METIQGSGAMDQKIFQMGLSVESVSAYILCCTLKNDQSTISTKNLLPVWNSSQDKLDECLSDLVSHHILKRIMSDQSGNDVYQIIHSESWK